MLKQAAYLYNNVQTLYTDLVSIGVGYRKMYARTMKLYKGIDNSFQIKLLNGDQKLVNAVGQTLFWILLDRTTAEIKFMLSKIVEGSDNSLITFTVGEGDLEAVNGGMYMYSSYLMSDAGKKTILYGDSQYGASVPVEVVSNSFPQAYPSVEITEFTNSENLNYLNPDNSKYTSAINARPELNGKNNALHTATFYSTNFVGKVNIETTLENGVTDVMQWVTLKSVTITDPINYTNFNGVFTFVRFRVVPDSANAGTVDKILYRS
jgi:hypothetical protein